MTDKDTYIDKFVEKLGDNLLEDLRKAFPKHLETILEQRLKGIRSALEPVERIEQEMKLQAKDIETLMISFKSLQENVNELTINSKELPKEIKATIKEDNKDLAEAVSKDLENLSERKSKSLLRFFRRKR